MACRSISNILAGTREITRNVSFKYLKRRSNITLGQPASAAYNIFSPSPIAIMTLSKKVSLESL
jgi:hypothetical protein